MDLRAQYASEPWGKLAIAAGFDPVNTESAARDAFRFCAERESRLVAALQSAGIWMAHWERDRQCRCIPTEGSLAQATQEIVSTLAFVGVK